MKNGSGESRTRVFKTRVFDRWARRERLADEGVLAAATEIASGMIDARLGGQIFKKRIALPGRGKRGGGRTLVAFRQGHGCFFIYGYAKNEREDINCRALATLQAMARRFLDLSVVDLLKSLQSGELIEIEE